MGAAQKAYLPCYLEEEVVVDVPPCHLAVWQLELELLLLVHERFERPDAGEKKRVASV